MTDEELLLESANLPTMYFDGFGAYRRINGVLRSVGYILGSGAQLNLITSLAGAEIANRTAREILDEKPAKCLQIWGGTALAH